MIDLDSIKIFSPGYDAVNWGFGYDQFVDQATALQQPVKIAAMPVFYDRPTEFSYKPEFATVDLGLFDLVLFTDIEFRSQTELMAWIETTGVKNWLLCVGGLWNHETLGPRTVYRPTWSFTFLQWNPPRDDFPLERPFLFDCLCGARREHRDFAMLSLVKSGLIDQSIATYRDVFLGGMYRPKHDLGILFPNQTVPWPYVSPNLDPAWEVKQNMDNTVSSIVPWEIYNRTYYTMLMETLGYGDTFLMAEKIGKCLLARRLFVHFGAKAWLKKLRSFGFETFDSVIDESYDDIHRDIRRWSAAFEQVQYLSKQNHSALLQKIKPILDHNRNRLFEFKEEKFKEMRNLVLSHLN